MITNISNQYDFHQTLEATKSTNPRKPLQDTQHQENRGKAKEVQTELRIQTDVDRIRLLKK